MKIRGLSIYSIHNWNTEQLGHNINSYVIIIIIIAIIIIIIIRIFLFCWHFPLLLYLFTNIRTIPYQLTTYLLHC